MKAVFEDIPKDKLSYPKLMSSRDLIVLMTGGFSGEGTGTVVSAGGAYPLGFYSETWTMQNFVDVSSDKRIMLSND